MQLSEIIHTLQLETLCGAEPAVDADVQSAYVSDMLSEVMAHAPRGCLWITHQTNENVIAIGYFKELAAILLPRSGRMEEEVLEKAKAKKIPVLSSAHSAFELAGRLYALGLREPR
ncbi:MAG: DRTGG domain protein [bacterium ADurb.Bin478]|nr:MAG: DRTGG domain protein [bacterium ADurb.Bin478]